MAPILNNMIVLNAIFPIFVLLFLGSFLRTAKIINTSFIKTSDKLVYYVFFPAMLFWKIGQAPSEMDMALDLCIAAIIAVFIVYLISLALIKGLSVPRFKAGAFSQACYRFNTYIGMAIVMTTLGETGIQYFGILIGFAIPIINILAVSTLIWYSGEKENIITTATRLIKALVANPLILACAAGLFFARYGILFPQFIDNTFQLMTAVTMPLALISIGGGLTFSGIQHNTAISLIAAGLKILVLPMVGFLLLKTFSITGIPFKAGMIFFCLPTSTAIYVLSSQLNSDTQLASAAIMMSTIFSFISLSVAILI